jgi:hypothetical protein
MATSIHPLAAAHHDFSAFDHGPTGSILSLLPMLLTTGSQKIFILA